MKLLLLLLPLTLLPTLLRLELGIATETTDIAPAATGAVESPATAKPADAPKEPAAGEKKPRAKASGRISPRHALLFM